MPAQARKTATDSGLNWSTTYYYTVTAFNAAGSSAASNMIPITMPAQPLTPPTLGVLMGSSTALRPVSNWTVLYWSPGSAADSYTLCKSESPGSETTFRTGLSASSGFIDDFVIPGHTYYYTLIAVRAGGNSTSNEVSITVPGTAPIAAMVMQPLVSLGQWDDTVPPHVVWASAPAGNYRVDYKYGAMKYHAASNPGWYLNANAGQGFRITYSGGVTVEAPHTGYSVFGDYSPSLDIGGAADVAAANAGAFLNFTHTGGNIEMFLQDSPYGDNVADGWVGSPLFVVTRLS